MEDEQEVIRATHKFYEAIESMVKGDGLEALEQTWHHTESVTSRHPMDDWATGWEQVWATWQVAATFGRADRGGSHVVSVKVHVHGDMAYAAVVFRAAPAWGGEKLMCTNVLLKKSGEWKIIHHHADPSAAMQVALERMLSE